MEPADLLAPAFLALAGWQPCCEELLFRGYLQGLLRRQSWGRLCRAGVTRANVLVSLLFALGHAWAHPPLWAVAVFFPSLVFGSLRDRYESVYPAVALHILYNAGYFALTGGR
ncbi:MAG: JDVT-CTERM system glutamic-type intramembrane protease [Candidatus Tectimicrobiota bacterium]